MELLLVIAIITALVIAWRRMGRRTNTLPALDPETAGRLQQHINERIEKFLPLLMWVGRNPNIALNPGEEMLCFFEGVTLQEPRAVRYTRSAYGGHSVRIARGWSVRFGQGGNVSESREEMRTIDHGTLVLTSQRLVFCGSKRPVRLHSSTSSMFPMMATGMSSASAASARIARSAIFCRRPVRCGIYTTIRYGRHRCEAERPSQQSILQSLMIATLLAMQWRALKCTANYPPCRRLRHLHLAAHHHCRLELFIERGGRPMGCPVMH